jgi:alpha-galactosidase
MNPRSIVIIGAGSASFGPTTLATILNDKALRGSRLALVDIDPKSLDAALRVAERMNESWKAEMAIVASTDRREVLEGATHVVVSIEVAPREALWRLDWEIPLRHGLRQPYAENGGPGGFMHACRQIPQHLAIAGDMEMLCPTAWLILFSNPLPRITRAIRKYTKIKAVGKCHQINVGYALTAALLSRRYGIDVPTDVTLHSDPGNVAVVHQLAKAGRRHFSVTSAGLNHFIWLLNIHDKATGEDLYPMLRAAVESAPPLLEPLSLELFRLFGLLPIAGDTHLSEYLPWLHDPITGPWERYKLPLYDWSGNEGVREVLHVMMGSMAGGELPVDGMREAQSEGAAELIAALGGDESYLDETVNVPNQGTIVNLPPETIVEVPAMVGNMGVQPVNIGSLPEPIAELCRREAALVDMVVDAAVTGDRQLALQALLLDPMINDIGRAKAILDDYLTTFAAYLPQFNSGNEAITPPFPARC